jgi:hypothetical protein
MYAFAILAWEVLTRQIPFKNQKGFVRSVLNGERPSFENSSETIPPPVKTLIESCWHQEREKRISAMESFSILSAVYEKFTHGEYDIFFSHAWKDKPFLSHIHHLLVKKGYRVWYDLNEMGYDFKKSMQDGIANSRVVLVCLNQHYLTRSNCIFELKEASKQNKVIIPLILEDKFLLNLADVSGDPISILDFSNKMFVDIGGYAEKFKVGEAERVFTDVSDDVGFKSKIELLLRLLKNVNCCPSFPTDGNEFALNDVDSNFVDERTRKSRKKDSNSDATKKAKEMLKELKAIDKHPPFVDAEPDDAAEEARKVRQEIAKQARFAIKNLPNLPTADDYARALKG